MTRRDISNPIIPLIVLAIIAGCGGDNAHLDIRADGWPEGTALSVLAPDGVTSRTTIYGGRTRLPLPSGPIRLQAAHPEMLTVTTDTLTGADDAGTMQLPGPIARRRFGSWRFGIGFDHSAADSLVTRIVDESPLSITTVALDSSLCQLVSPAHEAAVECLLIEGGGELDALIDYALRNGFDGIVVDIGSVGDAESSARYELLRERTRERGLTLTVRAAIQNGGGSARLDSIAAWFAGLPAGWRPDEFRLAFRGDADVPVVSAVRIEESAVALNQAGVPMHIMSFDLSPAAVKYHVNEDGTLTPAEMKAGEVEFLFAIVSGTPGVRLRDGSLRIGSRGDLYVVEDAKSIAGKVRRLRSGPLSTSGGVHLVCDEYGVVFGPDDMARIAGAVTAPETL